METKPTDHDLNVINKRHDVVPPAESRQWVTRPGDRSEERAEASPPIGLRVRWGGVSSGVGIVLGTLLLLTALGLAIGITAVGDPRTATDTTASSLGIGAGIWAGLTLLIAYFAGGLVSTRVTDRPDRGGALIHGALVWTLASVFLLWIISQGISFGVSSLFGAFGGLARATTAATATVTEGSNLEQRLGLTDPSRVIDWLNDSKTVSLFASVTGMSTQEAQTALTQLRNRVEAVRDNPERVATEVRTFLAQYAERAQQQALRAAAAVQQGASTGSWITFGVLALTLVMSILGALAGIPGLQSWRSRRAHAGAA